MFGVALGQGRRLQQFGFVHAGGGADPGHLKDTAGQGAGLVKDHHPGAGQLFQIGRALDQDAAPARPADAAEKAQRDADDQRAGAGDDQEGQRPVDPAAEIGRQPHQQPDQRGQQRQRQRAVADRRGVHPGEPGDEVLRPGLFHAGIFHQVQDTGDGRLPKLLGGAHPQQPADVDAAADDLIPGFDVPGQALAGQGGGVQGRSALHHHAVDGHPLAGLHHDDRARLHLVGVDLFKAAVRLLKVGVVGADVHQSGDAAAALAHRHALEQFPDLIEQDDGAPLGVLAQGEGAHRRHRHQKALVKGLPVFDPLQRLDQHVPPHHQVGDEIEQRHRHRHCRQQPGTGQQGNDGHQRRAGQDAVQHLLLLGVHGRTPPLFHTVFALVWRRAGFLHRFHRFSAGGGESKSTFCRAFWTFPQNPWKTAWKKLKTLALPLSFCGKPGPSRPGPAHVLRRRRPRSRPPPACSWPAPAA